VSQVPQGQSRLTYLAGEAPEAQAYGCRSVEAPVDPVAVPEAHIRDLGQGLDPDRRGPRSLEV
jgi:hypothetical protein